MLVAIRDGVTVSVDSSRTFKPQVLLSVAQGRAYFDVRTSKKLIKVLSEFVAREESKNG